MARGCSPARRGAAAAPMMRMLLMLMLMLLCGAASVVRSQRLVGGRQEVPASDPGAREATAFAVDAYNQGSNSLFFYKPLRVLKVETQVVSGMKYFVTVVLVKTQCEKRGNGGLKHVDLQRCSVPPEAEQEKLLCKFQVWTRPWLHQTELVSMKCQPLSS